MALDPADLGRYFGGVGAAPVDNVQIIEDPTPAESVAKTTPVGQVSDSKIDFAALASAVTSAVNPVMQAMQGTMDAMAKQNQTIMSGQNIASAAATAAKDAQKTNWVNAGKQLLATYDLGSLGDIYVNSITTGGLDQDTAMLQLQQTKEWKTRFSANETRLAQGLPVLDPKTYFATEQSYKQVMISAGLSPSIYNDVTKLGQLIAKDVSPVELKQRTDAAQAVIDNADPFVTQQLQQFYGLTKSDMVSHILDPATAAPVIAQKVQAATVAAEAARQGLGIGTDTAMALAGQGITQAQAAKGYQTIASMLPDQQALAAQFGANAGTVGQELSAQIFGGPNAATAQKTIQRQQQAAVNVFSGSAGAAKGSLGTDQSGSL